MSACCRSFCIFIYFLFIFSLNTLNLHHMNNEAEHFGVGYSDIVSHDPHLNSDGSLETKVLSFANNEDGGEVWFEYEKLGGKTPEGS